MSLRSLYYLLAIVGAALPFSQFWPFLATEGLDFPLMAELLFANGLTAFTAWNLILTGLATILYILASGGALGRAQQVLAIGATLVVGPSCGLPLALYFQQGCNLPR